MTEQRTDEEQEKPRFRGKFGRALGAAGALTGIVAGVMAGGPAVAREGAKAWDSLEGSVKSSEIVTKSITDVPFINGEVVLPEGTEIAQDVMTPTTADPKGVSLQPRLDARGAPVMEKLRDDTVIDQPMMIKTPDGAMIVFAMPGSESKGTVEMAQAPASSISSLYAPPNQPIMIWRTGEVRSSADIGEPGGISINGMPGGFGATREMIHPTDLPASMLTASGDVSLAQRGGAGDILDALETGPESQKAS